MRGLLFLLSALFLLESTKGEKYEELNDRDRKIVDEAIAEGNKVNVQGKHLDFDQIIKTKENVLNVILRPTSCDKTTPSVHRKECTTEAKKPQVSCVHCNGAMIKPCLFLKEKEQIKKRINDCQIPPPPKHIPGSGSLLAHRGENRQQQTGCLGCI